MRDIWLRNLIATLAEHLQRNAAFSSSSGTFTCLIRCFKHSSLQLHSSVVLRESDQEHLATLIRLCRWSSDAEQQILQRTRAKVLECDSSSRLCDWSAPASSSASALTPSPQTNQSATSGKSDTRTPSSLLLLCHIPLIAFSTLSLKGAGRQGNEDR